MYQMDLPVSSGTLPEVVALLQLPTKGNQMHPWLLQQHNRIPPHVSDSWCYSR